MSTADMVEIEVKNGKITIVGADIVQTRNALELRAERGLDVHEVMDLVTKLTEARFKIKQLEDVLTTPSRDWEKLPQVAFILGVECKDRE